MRHYIKQEEVIKISTLSKCTLWRLRKKKKFPPLVKLADNRFGYASDEIEKWLADPENYCYVEE